MAKDHFKKHAYQKDRIDWNFNILVGLQPDVARMASEYVETLSQLDGLYDPIPPEWLHMTVLRVGLTDDYTNEEMQKVADALTPKLTKLNLPELTFDSWWQWGGNIVFHISPDETLTAVYDAVIEALKEIVGEDRTTHTPHGQFLSHVSFAYTKDHQNEVSNGKILSNIAIAPATFRAPALSMIKQWSKNGHYEWEIIRDLPIGQNSTSLN